MPQFKPTYRLNRILDHVYAHIWIGVKHKMIFIYETLNCTQVKHDYAWIEIENKNEQGPDLLSLHINCKCLQ